MLVTQSCPAFCNPMNCSPPGSSVHEFSRQEYWSGLPFPSPGDLPNPGIEPGSCALQADSLPVDPPGKPNTTCKSSLLCVVGQSGGQAGAELMRSNHATCYQDRTQIP